MVSDCFAAKLLNPTLIFTARTGVRRGEHADPGPIRCVRSHPPFADAVSFALSNSRTTFRMTFDLRGALRALACWAGALLAFVIAASPMVAATAPANGSQIVSVDVTGNLHVPTATIMAVVASSPGPDVRSEGRARRPRADQRARLLRRHRPAAGAAASERHRDHVSRRREPRHHQNRVRREPKGAQRHAIGADGLSVGQVFNTNTFRQDVLKINNYYERIGYGGQVPTHVKDINLDPKTGT